MPIFASSKLTLGGRSNGVVRIGYFYQIIIKIRGVSYRTKVGFTDGMRDDAYGMVGQKGFFDRFAIKFDYAERNVVLHKKN